MSTKAAWQPVVIIVLTSRGYLTENVLHVQNRAVMSQFSQDQHVYLATARVALTKD